VRSYPTCTFEPATRGSQRGIHRILFCTFHGSCVRVHRSAAHSQPAAPLRTLSLDAWAWPVHVQRARHQRPEHRALWCPLHEPPAPCALAAMVSAYGRPSWARRRMQWDQPPHPALGPCDADFFLVGGHFAPAEGRQQMIEPGRSAGLLRRHLRHCPSPQETHAAGRSAGQASRLGRCL
jgi:hypothetical protein